MASEMAEAMKQLIEEQGYTKEQVLKIIEDMLKAAYKKTFGTNVNAIVQFNDDESDVSIYSRKVIVDGVYDPVTEIELEEAKEYADDVEVGDEIDILLDPKHDFARSAVQTGKQSAHQSLSEIQRDSLYAEYKDKVGEIIIGYYQREKNGTIYVDLGKAEGVLPVKNQSPREAFTKGDRIKALITEIRTGKNGLQIILSRTSPDFVRAIVELEVPEIEDGTVEINKIVREAGYRTKIAVSSSKTSLDPVGSCVGQKGTRIQTVIKEIEGEKIDVLRYDSDPQIFIKNALLPAKVMAVVITDEEKKMALAIVADDQLSLAIGKQGLNVRLANRLTDWIIDVKTEDQCDDSIIAESRRNAQNIFNNAEDYYESESLSKIPGIDAAIVELLAQNEIVTVDDFDIAYGNGSLDGIEGLTEDAIDEVSKALDEWEAAANAEAENVVEENIETAEQNAEMDQVEEDEEEYVCPNCGAKITTDMTKCPSCGVELSFEFEDEE